MRLICAFFSIFLQERPLHHNTSEGVILTNRSLVLQRIDRTRSGDYTCQAVNGVGNGRSQEIQLDVKCKNAFFTREYTKCTAGSTFCFVVLVLVVVRKPLIKLAGISAES
jgi:hypothetical protein